MNSLEVLPANMAVITDKAIIMSQKTSSTPKTLGRRPGVRAFQMVPSQSTITCYASYISNLFLPFPIKSQANQVQSPSTLQSQRSPWPSSSAPTASPPSAQQEAKHRIKQRHCLVHISAVHEQTMIPRGYGRLWKKVAGRKGERSRGPVNS